MPVQRARQGIMSLMFIAAALCACPRPALAAVVEANLRAALLAGLPSFEVITDEGTVGAPEALATVRPLPGWVLVQVDDLADPGPGAFDVLEVKDLTTPLTGTAETGFGRAEAMLRADELAAGGSVQFDPSTRLGFAVNAAASRNFEVTMHGAGTLLVSIPFRLEASVTGHPTTDEIFASASVSLSATRSRRLSFGTVDELYFNSAATLSPYENPPEHPDVQVDALTLAVTFIDGDTLRIFIDAGTQLNTNLQPVPLPASGPLLVAGLIALMRRRRGRSLPRA